MSAVKHWSKDFVLYNEICGGVIPAASKAV
jgi:hypothetical protein